MSPFAPLALAAAFEEIDAEAPRRLWHALVFYTAGELTREALAEAGIEGFQPYAEKLGFYERDSWAGYRAAFDAHWKPMLAGATERGEAYAAVAVELAGK